MSRRTGPALVALLCGAVSLLAQTSAFCQESTATVASLRCEYLQDPLGLGVRDPRLFWQISSSSRGERQTAFQVIVASDESRLDERSRAVRVRPSRSHGLVGVLGRLAVVASSGGGLFPS